MDDDTDGPVPVSLLADLQAGLLDDDAAAQLRRRARTDPLVAGQLAALDRVRRDVATLGADAASAPPVPSSVTSRIGAALRELPTPDSRSSAIRWRGTAAVVGVLAAVVAAGVGSAVLLRDEPRNTDAAGVTTPEAPVPGGIPVADAELLGLLTRPADPGPLADPQRLASCLTGLGYPPSTAPLGARPLEINGRPGVLLLLAGDLPRRVNAVVVAPNCSSIDTGLLASTVVNRT